MEEIWKPVHFRPDLYMISNLGNIKSVNYNHTKREKLMSPVVNKLGYARICLYIPKKSNKSIHRMVAIAFLPNPDNLPQVNHINGIKTDNHAENLEWVSVVEQNTHKHNMKKTKTGYTGVNPASEGMFVAHINLNKKRTFLGKFYTAQEAHAAYLQALKDNNITNKYATVKS